jgi:aspartate kinase
MDVVVQKYGGSSLATLDRIRLVAQKVAAARRLEQPLVIVVSAMGDTTDNLLDLADQMTASPSAREVDTLLATGESQSAALLALALRGQGVRAVSLSGGQAGIRVTGQHSFGVISEIDAERVTRLLADKSLVVVAGFQGINDRGDVITLGRGGSDTTAVAVAVALKASRCEIYTDVSGVCTADPRLVPAARLLPVVNSLEMMEMACTGAKIVHTRAVELAAMHKIDIHVGSTLDEGTGTVIVGGVRVQSLEASNVVVAITHDIDVVGVSVHAGDPRTTVLDPVLSLLSANSVPVDLLAEFDDGDGCARISFMVSRRHADTVREELQSFAASGDISIKMEEGMGKVSVVGTGLLSRPEYTARMLSRLSDVGIPASRVFTSQYRSSVVIPLPCVDEAVNILHQEFELAGDGEPARLMTLA